MHIYSGSDFDLHLFKEGNSFTLAVSAWPGTCEDSEVEVRLKLKELEAYDLRTIATRLTLEASGRNDADVQGS